MATRMADLDELIRQGSRSQPDHLEPRICEALMLAYYDFVFHLAHSFLGDPNEADDAAQETFIQATQHIHQYQTGTHLKSWLATIAINVCRGKYRRQKARRRLEQILQRVAFQMNAFAPTPEDTCLQTERQQVILQAIDALGEKQRLPILLRYVHGLSVPEIAQVLDEKEGTIYSRLHYALQRLRGRLDSNFANEDGKPCP
jgi:RNA polymerase sigma-70 factor (ECF subfamily)